jgi:hypothetical protein
MSLNSCSQFRCRPFQRRSCPSGGSTAIGLVYGLGVDPKRLLEALEVRCPLWCWIVVLFHEDDSFGRPFRNARPRANACRGSQLTRRERHGLRTFRCQSRRCRSHTRPTVINVDQIRIDTLNRLHKCWIYRKWSSLVLSNPHLLDEPIAKHYFSAWFIAIQEFHQLCILWVLVLLIDNLGYIIHETRHSSWRRLQLHLLKLVPFILDQYWLKTSVFVYSDLVQRRAGMPVKLCRVWHFSERNEA